MEYLYDEKKKCIVCDTEFNIKKVKKSKLRPIKTDSDFYTLYKDINPYFYDYYICSSCGVVFTDSFKKLNVSQKEQLKEVYKNISHIDSLLNERTIGDALRLSKLAVLSGNAIGLTSDIMAGLCIRVAWFNREEGNKEEENRFLELALREYEKTYEIGEGKLPEDTLLYMLGELNYRLDRYEECKKWFSRLMVMNTKIAIQGKKRWQDIKSEMDKK